MLYISNFMLELNNNQTPHRRIMEISWNKRVLLGILCTLIGISLLISDLVNSTIAYAVINTGTIVTIAAYKVSRQKNATAHDERSRAIGAKAASYSWMLTYFLVAILVWLVEFNWFNLTLQMVLGLLLAQMSVTLLVYKWWFNNHGEI